MKRVLIVTPNLSTGGTNSSLSCFYDLLKGNYSVDVFAMSYHGQANISFKECLLPENKLLSLWNCVYDELESKTDKLIAVFLKSIRRLSVKFKWGLDSKVYNLVLKRLRTEQYDIVISFQEGAATKFVSLCNAPRKYAWVHCNYSNWHPKIKQEEIDVYQKFNRVVCVSKHTASVFNSIFKLGDNVVSIYNLQDVDKMKLFAKEHISDIEWNINTYNIISVGRINAVKHFREIPEIAKRLTEKGFSFHWYIIGPEFDHEEMRKIKEGIERNNLSKVVFYLGPKTNPYPYFANADLYVCLSESEACPMVFNEAKCFGTPIVSTVFGSSYEFIQSEKDGIIIPRELIFEAIKKYIQNGRIIHESSRVVSDNNEFVIKQITKLLNA